MGTFATLAAIQNNLNHIIFNRTSVRYFSSTSNSFMDIRFKKMFAGMSAAAIMLSQVTTAFAAYSDVPAGVWFESAVSDFVERGILDSAQTRFRGTENATRAEFFKLVVELNGGALSEAPAVPSFDDVSASAWYYKYIEEAAKEGWVRGDGSCYGKHPCYARPNGKINRAEAAATIVRAFGLESSGSASQFVDNPSGQWYTAAVQTAADSCVVQGDADSGRVRPSDNMNRAEMVVMLSRAEQNLAYGKDCGTVSTTEPSVKDAVALDATTVEVSFNVSLDQTSAEDKSHYSITGSPELPISSVKLTSSDTVEITVSKAMDAGHQYTLTVADVVAADGKKFSDSTSFTGYTTVVQGNGALEVTLAAKNPVGDTLPKGAVGVVFTTLDLTAGQDDVSIENLTVLHEGFGSSADFSGVYGLVDGARVTRKRTIDSQSYTATMRFTSPLVVKAGKTVTLQIAGDLVTTATTAAEHALTVELPSDFISNAKSVKGNFPLKGNTFRTAAVTSGVATIAYRSVTPSTIKVGDKAASLGKWELSIDSTEDQTIYSMTLENDGTASDGDFVNLAIKRSDGTLLTKTVAATVSDFATLVFDPPFTVLEGDRVTMTLVGDIKGGAAKNIKIHFDETGDIFAVGSLYGYGVNGQLYGSAVTLPTETATLPGTVSIDAGQFTIAVDGPVTEQYTRKDKNVVLANVSFTTGGEDVDVEQLFILLEAKTSTGAGFVNGGGRAAVSTAANEVHEALEKVELRNTTTGRTVSGVRLTASGDSGATSTGSFQVYRFDDFIIRGAEKYEIRANFIDNSGISSAAVPANGDKFRAHICGEATHNLNTSNELVANTTGCAVGGWFTSKTAYQMKIKGVTTNDRVGDYRPGGTVSGNFQEIRTAGLTVTGKATTTSETSVKNAKNVSFIRFEARANEAADVLVTDLIFEAATSASLVNASNYALWVDTNDDGVVDTVLQNGVSSQSSKITFDKVTGGGYVIAKQKSVIFEVHADIASSLVTSNPVMALRFATGSTYIQAEQVHDGSSLANISTNGSSTTAEIQVTTAVATQYTLRNQGDLFVVKSSTPVRARQLLGGALGDEVLRLQFHAEYEDIDVTDLVFSGSGANASTFATNVDRLELYTVGSTTPFAYATVAGCGSDAVPSNSMCANMENQEFIVKKGADTNILVRPRTRTDVDGATSAQVVALTLDSTASSSTGSVRARGLLSSSNLSANNGDSTADGEVVLGNSASTANVRINGNYNQVALAKVTSITNADPNANGTAIPTGVRKIAQFKFSTAAANNLKNGTNKWTLSGVMFNVNATNVILGSGDQTASGTSDFKLYNAADATQKATCLSDKATSSGTLVVTCRNLRSTTVSTEIDPGTDATFVLEAEVANSKISNSSTSTLQVSLQNFSESPTALTFTSSTSHISWQDKDNSSTTTFRWIEYPETSVNGTSYNG